MEPIAIPQQADEPTPLVVPTPQEPVLRSTRIWTVVGFVAAFITILLFAPYSIPAISLQVVLCPIIYAALAYLLYRYIVLKVGAPVMRHDLAQAYIACGLFPYVLLVSISNFSFLLVAYYALFLILNWLRPAWLQRIIAAMVELGKHGELKVNGIPLKSLLQPLAKKSGIAMRYVSSRLLHASSIVSHHEHVAEVVDHVSRAIVKIGNSNGGARNRVVQFISKMLRLMVYEDGTKAGPIFGELFRSFASIPYWFTIPVLLFFDVVALCIMLSILSKLVQGSLKRPNPTIHTVTACAMSIVLGQATLPIFINGFAFKYLLLYIPAVIFSLAIAALIAMRLFDNSQTVFENEKRPVILLPVALRSIFGFAVLVCWVVFTRYALNILADAAELRIDLNTVEPLLKRSLLFTFLVPGLVLVAVTVYTVRLAYNRFSSSRALS